MRVRLCALPVLPRASRRAFAYLIVVVVVGAALLITPAVEAAATCKCKVQCSFPNAPNFNDTPNWPKRPNGNNFNYPHSSNEWDECKDYCQKYVYGLDLQAMAGARNSCGTVECASTYWLGERPELAGEHRRVQVECLPTSPAPTDCQYAVKFVCGTANPGSFVHPGDYRTTVNVHNPGTAPADTRHKVALAQMHQDGSISAFVRTGIGSDGAQFYDCEYLRSLAGSPGLIDGFFVIESHSELDVAAYYTSSDATPVNAIHVEKYPCRQVPRHSFLCQADVSINLAQPQNWVTGAGPAAVIATQSAWDQNRSWMSYAADGSAPEHATLSYRLDFCSCPGGNVAVSGGDVKSDNDSSGKLVLSSSLPLFDVQTTGGVGNFGGNKNAAALLLLNSAFAGSGAVAITVQNPGGPSGLSVTGTLKLSNGYLGRCQPQ